MQFGSPTHPQAIPCDNLVRDEIFGMAQGVEAQRIAGSVISPYIHQEVVSSYVFPSSMGMWAIPSTSGVGLGVHVSTLPEYSRKFWSVADAELIVYGATEPDATVSIGGRPMELNPDGTFRFQISFQDGLIDYPIVVVAVDGEQTCSIYIKFNRETQECHANSQEEAVLECPQI